MVDVLVLNESYSVNNYKRMLMLSGRGVYTFWSLLRNVTDFIYVYIY